MKDDKKSAGGGPASGGEDEQESTSASPSAEATDDTKATEETESPPQPQPQEENVDYKEAYIRAQADYQNLVKDQEKKRKEWIEFANLGLLTDLIPTIEYFHQGLKYVPKEVQKEDWFVGFKQIKKKLDEFMFNNDLARLHTVGRKFDPNMHDAVGKRKEDGKDVDEILEEVMGGYTLHGKVVQPAKVIVNE